MRIITDKRLLLDAAKQYGTMVKVNNEEWYYFPYWFKKSVEEDHIVILSFDELPEALRETIKKIRGEL